MFKDNLIAYLAVNGKVLREKENSIQLPFGTEYSICLKNENSRLAVVNVWVDGEDVLDGNSLVVHPKAYLELEGFMDGLKAKNKFKFIEKTQQIEEYRGNKPEDGLIKIEFRYQKENIYYVPYWTYTYPIYHYREDWVYPEWKWYNTDNSSSWNITLSNDSRTRVMSSASVPTANLNNISTNYAAQLNDDGITVKGSEVDQQFRPYYAGNLEDESHVMVLKLSGYKGDKKVEAFVTTKEKIICKTCGNKNEYNDKFCSNCGTYLK